MLLLDVAFRLELPDEDDDDEDEDESIRCVLLVNTRLESFLNVCVKFRDASANAGLSVLSSCCSTPDSIVLSGAAVEVDANDVEHCAGVGFITRLVDGRWWNGIERTGCITLCVSWFVE